MAAYAQSITAAGMKLLFESTQNVSDKEIIYSMCDILNTEYAAMASAGLEVYTVTTGLQASLEALCRRMSDAVQVEILKSFFTVLTTEFASVQTNDLGYTQTDPSATATYGPFSTFEGLMKSSIDNYSEVLNRIMFHNLIAQIVAEHVLLVAAV